ncbi:MAG: hypothetical protein AAGA81_00950 [Acidobacteriota bacterium]
MTKRFRRTLDPLGLSLLLLAAPLSGADDALSVLDANRDGVVDPFEVLDGLLVLEDDLGRPPTFEEIEDFAAEQKSELNAEMTKLLAEFDANGDGVVKTTEAEDDERDVLEAMDANDDGTVELAEAVAFDFAATELASEAEIEERIEEAFRAKDVNRNGVIDLPSEVAEQELGRYTELDLDRDGRVEKREAKIFWLADNTPVRFEVEGRTARMTGVITAALPATVLRLLHEHPAVDTIEMQIVPGSIDDHANLRAALYVFERGLTTRLTATSTIASGGTDFFLGGATRIVEPGAILGVHSWGGGPVPATEVPRDDPQHRIYLEFYEAVDVPMDFYWYTLESAPAAGMHIMTEDELARYRVRRGEPPSSQPSRPSGNVE